MRTVWVIITALNAIAWVVACAASGFAVTAKRYGLASMMMLLGLVNGFMFLNDLSHLGVTL